ncbi:MAG: S1C family serine protease, partial [Dehalococcoidia bacterium]
SVVQIRSTHNLALPDNSPRLPDIPGFPFDRGPGAPEDFFERSGGTGFVWDNQGHIVTNHHVVNGADRVTVIFADRTELEAKVLGSDPDSDLAVLQIENPDGLPPAVNLGDSDQVKVGQMATAIGNPFGQEFTITRGIVSAVGRTIRSGNSSFSIPEVIQTDAPINPGNSGGPLLDRRGRVIGVNTQIISRSGSNSGIGFSVPINIAKQVIPALLAEGSFNYAWLGISGTSLTPDVAEMMNLPRDTRGALIIDLIEDGPAAKSDLQGSDTTGTIDGLDIPIGGDVIVAINGAPIEGIDDLIAYLVSNTRPNQEVTLEVIRGDGERVSVQVTLGQRPGSL